VEHEESPQEQQYKETLRKTRSRAISAQRRSTALSLPESCMMPDWLKEASAKRIHIRSLLTFAGDPETESLPIESAAASLRRLIDDNPLSGVRSPPGSGKTMFLPELLLEWARRDCWYGAVVIVLPTQFAAQKIQRVVG